MYEIGSMMSGGESINEGSELEEKPDGEVEVEEIGLV